MLACAFLATPAPGSPRGWGLALALVAPGAWLLAREARAATIAQVLTQAFAARPARVALVVSAGLIALTAWIFSVSAALAIALVFGTAILARGRRAGTRAVEGILAGAVTVGAVVLLGGLALEWMLGTVLAEQIGAPSAREVWERRYAELRASNLFGFRSPYENVVPAPGTMRVVALGDSYTWGDGIALTEETWPAQLEQRLRDTLRTPVEVINTGRSGWTTANEAELLRRFGWQWSPDLVVLQFTLNDVTESSPGFHDREDARIRVLPHRFRTGTIGRSAILFFLETRLSGLVKPYWGTTNPANYHPDSLAWRQTAAALREIGDSATARRVPVLLLIYPLLTPGAWNAETYPYKELINQVAGAGQQAGLDVVNLVEVYGAEGGDWKRWWVSPYDPHPNATANAIAVRALMAHINQRGYLARVRRTADVQPATHARTPPATP